MGVYQGTLRVRYREGLDTNVLMESGQVYEVEVDMNAISNTFLPGHRLRLEIASARFPNPDRNLGGGENDNDDINKMFDVLDNDITPQFPQLTKLIIAHPGHQNKDRPRGGAAILGNCDQSGID